MRRACLLGLFVACGVLADSKLYLKTRVIDTSDTAPLRADIQALPQSEISGRVHLLIQFDHVPGSDEIRTLGERGAAVLGYVHENGLVISIADASTLGDIGLRWMAQMDPLDKVSPLLSPTAAADATRAVLIEFHPDVNMDDVHRLVLDAGASLMDNPDLGYRHLLANASDSQIAALARYDQVAYIFPASDELLAGLPVTSCASALTAQGLAGQYIPKVGDGWDGPGKGSAAIGYYFSALSTQLPGDSIKSEILRAFAEWGRYVKLMFSAAPSADALQTINVLFAKREHGDGYAFDGPGGVLAHTFYPAPPNPESLAGDMHFDDDESWRIGADRDLFSVALHEAGHALGLGHSDRPGAVMYPYYALTTGLTADDIGAIQDLYAAQDSSGSSPVTPPAQPPVTTPSTPNQPSVQPLSLTIGTLAANTTADFITVTGSISGGTGATILNWSTDGGKSGSVSGTALWSAQIPLLTGANTITFTATDAQQSTASKSVVVSRQLPATPVSIQLTYPAGTGAFTTTQSAVNLRGTASHSSGIQRVSWSSDRGPSGQATGTTSWDIGPIALQSGVNNITVEVLATDGSIGSQAVQVTYVTQGIHDTTAPTLSIATPNSATSATISASIIVRGTASDNVGVTSVTWFTTTGASGNASGTATWSTPPIPLIQGDNSIVIRAFDAAGNMAWRVVNVTRQ